MESHVCLSLIVAHMSSAELIRTPAIQRLLLPERSVSQGLLMVLAEPLASGARMVSLSTAQGPRSISQTHLITEFELLILEPEL